jgi:pilus assembly protein CpaB
MNRSRMLTLACCALVLSAALTFAVYGVLRNSLLPQNDTVQVVTAAEPLAIGTRLTPEHLRLVSWPKAAPLAGSFTSTTSLSGRGVIVSMQPNEPVTESKLAPVEAGSGLTTAIPDGMRAVAVKVNDVIGVAGFVLPGTRVDVILSGSSEQGSEVNTAKVILENVQVLAAGQSLEQNTDGKPQNVQVITLLVTPDEAQRIALASGDGRIQLALRNPLDFARTDPPALKKSVLYNGPAPLAPAPPPASGVPAKRLVRREPPAAAPPPPPPVPRVVAVELIQGTTQKTTTFEIKPQN